MADPPVSLTGMAHLIMSVRNWEQTTAFHRKLFGFLGFTIVSDTENGVGEYDREFLYFVGGKTDVGFHRAEGDRGAFDQRRAGLHHYCLRARLATLEVFDPKKMTPMIMKAIPAILPRMLEGEKSP